VHHVSDLADGDDVALELVRPTIAPDVIVDAVSAKADWKRRKARKATAGPGLQPLHRYEQRDNAAHLPREDDADERARFLVRQPLDSCLHVREVRSLGFSFVCES
jgi:hypothetical protein